jgi:hypothetical protein
MTDRTVPRRLAAALAAACLCLTAGTVAAPVPVAAQAAKAAPASDQELRSFAAATKEIDGINREYRGRMKAAPGDSQKLQLEALDKIAERIEANGLSVERYSEIAQTLKTDTAVRDKVKAYMAQ